MKILILISLVLSGPLALAELVPGLFHRNKGHVPARGYFETSQQEPGYTQSSVTDKIWNDSYNFIVPPRVPCRADEYTVMERGFPKRFLCVDKKTFEKSIPAENVEQIDGYQILGHQEAALAFPEDKNAAKRLLIARASVSAWTKSGYDAPPGRYFYPHFFVDARGPFRSVYKEGERTGYETLSKATELAAYADYFVGSPLSPCDEKQEYTVYHAKSDGQYSCVAREIFDKMFSISLVSLSDIYPKRQGVSEKWVTGDDLQYCSSAARKAAKTLAELNKPRAVKIAHEGRGELVDEVDPDVRANEGTFPPIRIYHYSDAETVDGFLVTYDGLLYGACHGFCRRQGYALLLDEDGKAIRFLDSTLAQTSHEYDIPAPGLERVISLTNNENGKLAKLFASTFAPSGDYSASMSKASLNWGGGNTVGTVQLHISLVRDRLGFTTWPIYDWKDPVLEQKATKP